MTTATPSLTLVITIPSLSCRSSKASCSPFETFEYFDCLICAVLIFFFKCFYCMVFFFWWGAGGEGYPCCISQFSKYTLFYFWFICLVFKLCFKFNSSIKTIYFVKKFRFVEILFSLARSLNFSLKV